MPSTAIVTGAVSLAAEGYDAMAAVLACSPTEHRLPSRLVVEVVDELNQARGDTAHDDGHASTEPGPHRQNRS